MNLNIFNVIKHLSIISIVVLTISCIYYLVTAVQVMQQILEQLDRAQRLEGNTSGVPLLTHQARALYERHEISLIYQIIICSATPFISLLGLVVSVRECLPLILIYALIVKLVFVANFFLPSKLKPWIMGLMAFVSIISFSFAYVIRRQKTSDSLEVNLPDVYFNKNKVNVMDDKDLNND